MPAPQPFKRSGERSIPEAIELAAADWISLRDQGFAPGEAAAFQEWMRADRRHAAAVAELEDAWAVINRPRLAGRADAVLREIDALEGRRPRRGRRVVALAGTCALLAAAVAVGLFLVPSEPFSWGQVPPTVMLRPDRQLLPDGSTIELNSSAKVVVEFSAQKRAVRLLRGEALFSVAKDPARPFVVTVSGVEVCAVGTAFVVRQEPGRVDVLVTEGRVAVQRESDGRSLIGDQQPAAWSNQSAPLAERPVLIAGHRVAIPVADFPTPSLAVAPMTGQEIAGVLAWRQRRVEFTSTPLAEAVPLFNRGNPLQLALADAPTAELKISGVFWTDDPEGFARLLESSLGVTAVRSGEQGIVLRK